MSSGLIVSAFGRSGRLGPAAAPRSVRTTSARVVLATLCLLILPREATAGQQTGECYTESMCAKTLCVGGPEGRNLSSPTTNNGCQGNYLGVYPAIGADDVPVNSALVMTVDASAAAASLGGSLQAGNGVLEIFKCGTATASMTASTLPGGNPEIMLEDELGCAGTAEPGGVGHIITLNVPSRKYVHDRPVIQEATGATGVIYRSVVNSDFNEKVNITVVSGEFDGKSPITVEGINIGAIQRVRAIKIEMTLVGTRESTVGETVFQQIRTADLSNTITVGDRTNDNVVRGTVYENSDGASNKVFVEVDPDSLPFGQPVPGQYGYAAGAGRGSDQIYPFDCTAADVSEPAFCPLTFTSGTISNRLDTITNRSVSQMGVVDLDGNPVEWCPDLWDLDKVYCCDYDESVTKALTHQGCSTTRISPILMNLTLSTALAEDFAAGTEINQHQLWQSDADRISLISPALKYATGVLEMDALAGDMSILVRVDSRGASMGGKQQTWFMGCYEMQANVPSFGGATADTTAATNNGGDCETWPCESSFYRLDTVMKKNFTVTPDGLNRSCSCPLFLASSVYKVSVTATTPSWEWSINTTTNTVSFPIPCGHLMEYGAMYRVIMYSSSAASNCHAQTGASGLRCEDNVQIYEDVCCSDSSCSGAADPLDLAYTDPLCLFPVSRSIPDPTYPIQGPFFVSDTGGSKWAFNSIHSTQGAPFVEQVQETMEHAWTFRLAAKDTFPPALVPSLSWPTSIAAGNYAPQPYHVHDMSENFYVLKVFLCGREVPSYVNGTNITFLRVDPATKQILSTERYPMEAGCEDCNDITRDGVQTDDFVGAFNIPAGLVVAAHVRLVVPRTLFREEEAVYAVQFDHGGIVDSSGNKMLTTEWTPTCDKLKCSRSQEGCCWELGPFAPGYPSIESASFAPNFTAGFTPFGKVLDAPHGASIMASVVTVHTTRISLYFREPIWTLMNTSVIATMVSKGDVGLTIRKHYMFIEDPETMALSDDNRTLTLIFPESFHRDPTSTFKLNLPQYLAKDSGLPGNPDALLPARTSQAYELPYSVAPCPKDQYAEHCAIYCTREEHCTGNGYCIQRNALCGCDLGWMGPRCNYFCLAQESCNGQGQCMFYGEETACECTDGFVGDKCQYPCSAEVTCSGHGLCKVDGECVCKSGFSWVNASFNETLYAMVGSGNTCIKDECKLCGKPEPMTIGMVLTAIIAVCVSGCLCIGVQAPGIDPHGV